MPQMLPSKAPTHRSLAAVALFAMVYIGIFTVVLAPRDLIAVQSGSVFRDAD